MGHDPTAGGRSYLVLAANTGGRVVEESTICRDHAGDAVGPSRARAGIHVSMRRDQADTLELSWFYIEEEPL